MKTINSWLSTALNNPLQTIAHCMYISRKDGGQLFFTDHSEPLVINGNTYTPRQSTDASEMQSSSRANADNMELSGYLIDNAGLTKNDILLGKYDDAELLVFLVDYTNCTTVGAGDYLILKKFLVGGIRLEDDKFFMELRSLSDLLNKQIIEVTSQTCRAQFGDARCGLSLAPYTHGASITGVTNNKSFSASVSLPNNYFRYGKAQFTSGLLAGFTADISGNAGSAIFLFSDTPLDIQAGQSVTLTRGCDKIFSTCVGFGNAVNFRGEPHLPGIDQWKAGYNQTI